jgi:hypothetical protein
LEKWELLSAAREVLPSERVASCLWGVSRFKLHRQHLDYLDVIDCTSQVEVVKSKDRFHYGNLMICGSVWHCPICAVKVSEHRRSELVQGVEFWKKQSGEVLLLTLTVPHYSNQRLQPVLNGISQAFRNLTNTAKSRQWKSLCKSIGLTGRIRALEVTYGENGWHPHLHVLLFLYGNKDRSNLEQQILHLWQIACEKASLPIPNAHGVKIENGELAAQYVGKWGLEHEMTKGHIKKAREGYTPFDLLRVYLGTAAPGRFLDGQPYRAADLFREYAKAFKGKRQLVWSSGLRDALLSGSPDLTDEQIADQVPDDAELFALIPLSTWKIIRSRHLRGELLEACRQGREVLDNFLNSLEVHHV